MDEEFIDIVSESEEFVAKVFKSEAHKFGALHKTVIAEVVDSAGNIFLVKQASDRQDAGQFVSPVGGHVKAGESEEEALKRETQEEIGVEYFQFTLLGKKIFSREILGRKENHYFIVFQIVTDEVFTLGSEAVDFEKFTREQLAEEVRSNPKKFGDAFHFVYNNFYATLKL